MMDYYEFTEQVRERAAMPTEREALLATEATLKTLGERLSEVDAIELAFKLPPDIGRFLTVVDTDKEFNLDDFYEHIAEREHVDVKASRKHANVVLGVVEEIVGIVPLRKILARLPEEFSTLLE